VIKKDMPDSEQPLLLNDTIKPKVIHEHVEKLRESFQEGTQLLEGIGTKVSKTRESIKMCISL